MKLCVEHVMINKGIGFIFHDMRIAAKSRTEGNELRSNRETLTGVSRVTLNSFIHVYGH